MTSKYKKIWCRFADGVTDIGGVSVHRPDGLFYVRTKDPTILSKSMKPIRCHETTFLASHMRSPLKGSWGIDPYHFKNGNIIVYKIEIEEEQC